MSDALGATLPLAVGIAISPVPIIAAILMLLSPRARTTSVGFLLGWIVGIVITVTAASLLAGLIPDQDDDRSHPVRGVIQIALGILLLLAAIGQWRNRPRAGHPANVPKWMQAIDKATFPVALGLGMLLSAVNPKNLLLALSAGVDIGTAELTVSEWVGTIAIFTVIAASSILAPVVGYLTASARLEKPLDALRQWLQRENALIMALLMLIIGVVVIGKGIGSL